LARNSAALSRSRRSISSRKRAGTPNRWMGIPKSLSSEIVVLKPPFFKTFCAHSASFLVLKILIQTIHLLYNPHFMYVSRAVGSLMVRVWAQLS